MKKLGEILERFSKALNKGHLTKEAVVKVVFNHTNVKLSPESISLREGILQIEAGATLKNEIRLKEEVIKNELKESHGIIITRVFYK